MGLLEQILSAIDSPTQQASPDQLSQILTTVQQLAKSQGVNPQTTQTVAAVVGQFVRRSLQEKRETLGTGSTEEIVNQYSGVQPNSEAVQAILSPQQQQEVAQVASQKTGLDFSKIQAMLPILVPIILNLLQAGASKPGTSSSQQNSVLSTFLDTDNDGDIDLADTLSLASRFLG